MGYHERGRMSFPEYTGIRCYMMPFIQGRGESLPRPYAGYADFVDRFFIPGQEGRLGLITILNACFGTFLIPQGYLDDPEPYQALVENYRYGRGEKLELCRVGRSPDNEEYLARMLDTVRERWHRQDAAIEDVSPGF